MSNLAKTNRDFGNPVNRPVCGCYCSCGCMVMEDSANGLVSIEHSMESSESQYQF